MNEQAYQDQMADDAQFEAEQEALREEMLDKYDEFKPLLEEMIDGSYQVSHAGILEFLADQKEKLAKHMREDEYQEAIELMNIIMEG
jgi:hypothetical protein